MSKVLLGLLVGAALGLLDGLSAWFYPEVRPVLMSIVLGSTAKGLITGLVAGFVARRYRSLPLGIAVGGLVGLGLAYLAAWGSHLSTGQAHYLEIMLPGMVVGIIVGFVTQRYGASLLKNSTSSSRRAAASS